MLTDFPGGVEMEEKGERYRDGEKVTLHWPAFKRWVIADDHEPGAEILRKGTGPIQESIRFQPDF